MTLNELIDCISSENGNLETALLQMKVIAFRACCDKFLQWIDKEISGYNTDDELPKYRVLRTHVVGCVMNSTWKYSETTLPIGKLPEKVQNDLSTMKIYFGVKSIQQAVKDDQSFMRPITPEQCAILSRDMDNGFYVVNGSCKIIKADLINIIAIVRNTLLDMALNLEKSFPDMNLCQIPYNDNIKSGIQNIMTEGYNKNICLGVQQ